MTLCPAGPQAASHVPGAPRQLPRQRGRYQDGVQGGQVLDEAPLHGYAGAVSDTETMRYGEVTQQHNRRNFEIAALRTSISKLLTVDVLRGDHDEVFRPATLTSDDSGHFGEDVQEHAASSLPSDGACGAPLRLREGRGCG